MKFTISVHGAPYAGTSHQHAQKLIAALYEAGHQVVRVFFYHEAVYAALNSAVPAQDEADLAAQWLSLAAEHDLELAVCIANGLKRGVISTAEQQRYETATATLADPFELVGLGQLIDAINRSVRYIEFPA